MTPDYPPLNFPAVRLRVVRRESGLAVWDPLRKIYLVLTPEEWVRRHLIQFLTTHCGAQPTRIVQEYAVAMNGSPQRADVVVVDDCAQPLLLAECKAAGVKIGRETLAQAVRYNSVLRARYVVLTNGRSHYCYRLCEDGTYARMERFPVL